MLLAIHTCFIDLFPRWQYAYDAVWMFAEALDKMNISDRNELRSLRVYEQFHGLLNASDFTGISGQIDWFNK